MKLAADRICEEIISELPRKTKARELACRSLWECLLKYEQGILKFFIEEGMRPGSNVLIGTHETLIRLRLAARIVVGDRSDYIAATDFGLEVHLAGTKEL